MRVGQTVQYRLRVHNSSSVAVQNVLVRDRLPKRLAYVSSQLRARLTGGRYCWTIASLPAHG